MDAETLITNNTALASSLAKFKKGQRRSFAGSIPTLVESVVYESPIKESDNDEDDPFGTIDLPPLSNGPKSEKRRNSLGVLPKTRRGSLGPLTSFLGLKTRTDPSPGRDGNYTKSDDGDTPKLPLAPRRSSIAVLPSERGRRRSWAAKLQLERRRRKSNENDDDEEDQESPPVYSAKARRPSWWNALVPENMLKSRSRRASQQLSRSDESITQPYRRTKSRSVDHGFAAPFDLDSLRSKVEGRFDSVQKDEEETPSVKRYPVPPPIKTTTYVVKEPDTLTSVAARFDTTPSELAKINRLATNFIFPGQTLLVPDKDDGTKDGDTPSEGGEGSSDTSSQQAILSQERDFLENLRPTSPDIPSSPAAPQRFLKINVRHITDGQGVVSGVLLVTPNAVMFDPNVSDTLVLEHGPESYGVIAPMEFVVNAAIYYDIAHMRTHDENPNLIRGEKPEIYYMNKPGSPDKDSLVKDETFPELIETSVETEEHVDPQPIQGERGGDAFPKAFDRELVTPTGLQQANEERRRSLLDHHWAVPSKERMSVDLSTEVSEHREPIHEEEHEEPIMVLSSAPKASAPIMMAKNNIAHQHSSSAPPNALHLVKLSCHDSGIDIRDPLPPVQPNNTKKVYSDADIVLSQDWVPPVTILAAAEPPLSAPPSSSEERVRKQTAVSFSLETTPQIKTDETKGEKKSKMLKRLSYPLSWMEGLTDSGTGGSASGSGGGGSSSGGSQADSLPTSADSHNSGSVFSKVFNRRSSYGGFGKSDGKKPPPVSQPPRLDYRSMVSVDDMPELFASFDKLIPRPARSCDDPPLYLRLRMGRPTDRAVPRSTPLMSYGRKRMRPEYWFSVPRNRVDDLYKFLNHWVPELYGELGDVTERGYTLVDSDTELWDDEVGTPGDKGERSDSQGDMGDLTRESWEVLSMSDELRRALYSSGASVDMEFCPPDLIGTTEILENEHREKLCGYLPARAQGYMWSLVFSSSVHGFSLNSMYRKMQRVDSPVLLVIQDTSYNVFGALTSCALRPSEHFYGTGESLLFSFCASPPQQATSPLRRGLHQPSLSPPSHTNSQSPNSTLTAGSEGTPNAQDSTATTEEAPSSPTVGFRVWQWTGDNQYFIRGSNDNISIGAGDGKFGLWLDGDLNQGRTQSCTTYGNEPLSTQEDFIVKILECWAFI